MLELFDAIEDIYAAVTGSAPAAAINLQVWLFAVLQGVHLITLVMIACAVLVVDLRLLGLGLRRLPAARVAEEARPWLLWGLAGQAVTGLVLFASLAASKYYGHPTFHLKMYLLVAALLFTFVVRTRVIDRGADAGAGWSGPAVGAVSITLWSSVAIMAKWIAFY